MKKNMQTSGEHDNDPYNFVEVAMKKVGKAGLDILGCYYFYMRCELNPEVDVRFTVEMDDVLKGNTAELELSQKQQVKSTEKKDAFAAVMKMSNTASSIAEAMEETNRLAAQAQLISVVQALGKNDILENLLSTMSSNNH